MNFFVILIFLNPHISNPSDSSTRAITERTLKRREKKRQTHREMCLWKRLEITNRTELHPFEINTNLCKHFSWTNPRHPSPTSLPVTPSCLLVTPPQKG